MSFCGCQAPGEFGKQQPGWQQLQSAIEWGMNADLAVSTSGWTTVIQPSALISMSVCGLLNGHCSSPSCLSATVCSPSSSPSPRLTGTWCDNLGERLRALVAVRHQCQHFVFDCVNTSLGWSVVTTKSGGFTASQHVKVLFFPPLSKFSAGTKNYVVILFDSSLEKRRRAVCCKCWECNWVMESGQRRLKQQIYSYLLLFLLCLIHTSHCALSGNRLS